MSDQSPPKYGKASRLDVSDASKMASALLAAKTNAVINRGGHESPAAEMPAPDVEIIKPALIKKNQKKIEVKANYPEPPEATAPANFRIPLSLQKFIIKLVAEESLARQARVTATQLYTLAITEYARKHGYEG